MRGKRGGGTRRPVGHERNPGAGVGVGLRWADAPPLRRSSGRGVMPAGGHAEADHGGNARTPQGCPKGQLSSKAPNEVARRLLGVVSKLLKLFSGSRASMRAEPCPNSVTPRASHSRVGLRKVLVRAARAARCASGVLAPLAVLTHAPAPHATSS